MGKEDESFRAAFDVWQDKTDWVQKDRRFDVLNPWGMHRADVLKAFIEHLEGRITELELDCAEYIKFKEVMEMASRHLANDEPLDLESLFRGELASAMFSMMFAGELKRSGATNYLELSYDVPEFGGVIVTIQKQDGKTPGQRIVELEERIAELESRTVTVKQGEVLVTVSGFTGCGKSAIAGEIEIAMKAIGVPVTWANGDAEKRMTGADWLTAIEMYKPTVRIVEENIPRAAGIKWEAE